jgi:3-isopropylmalate/(R)-2-methylmalate dehydratase small subunit
MSGFTSHSGIAAPLNQANVDTDQIIPKQFLTGVTRAGYGKHLFHDWRYLDMHESVPNPDFVLNKPEHKGASILLAREDFGFQVIIATSFADIFYANCINNQMLPITLASNQMDLLFAEVENQPQTQITVDLPTQSIQFGQQQLSFEIAPHHKMNLIKGLDAIGLTLELDPKITEYESRLAPWL